MVCIKNPLIDKNNIFFAIYKEMQNIGVVNVRLIIYYIKTYKYTTDSYMAENLKK